MDNVEYTDNEIIEHTESKELTMEQKFDALQLRVADLEFAHDQLRGIKADTTELLDTFKALKGAWTVLNWIGKLAPTVIVLTGITSGIMFAYRNWNK